VESKEPGEGCVVYRESASDSLNEAIAYVRDCGEKISNDGSPPKRYLTPGENIPNKGGYHD